MRERSEHQHGKCRWAGITSTGSLALFILAWSMVDYMPHLEGRPIGIAFGRFQRVCFKCFCHAIRFSFFHELNCLFDRCTYSLAFISRNNLGDCMSEVNCISESCAAKNNANRAGSLNFCTHPESKQQKCQKSCNNIEVHTNS